MLIDSAFVCFCDHNSPVFVNVRCAILCDSSGACVEQLRRPEVFVLAGIANQLPVEQIEGQTLPPTEAPTKEPTTPRPSLAPNTPRPTLAPVQPKDVCGRTIYWDGADGKNVVTCLNNDMCKNYKVKVGTPCCLSSRCICSSTGVSGIDRCGIF
jgi:hypothetical protein